MVIIFFMNVNSCGSCQFFSVTNIITVLLLLLYISKEIYMYLHNDFSSSLQLKLCRYI